MASPIDASGLIPPTYSATVLKEAEQQSAALRLGRQIQIPAGVSHMPIPATFPTAAWTTGPGSRKSYTDFSFDEVTITAEEVAAVITIPDSYLEDASINLWDYARPLLAEAIAVALDEAVIWGNGAPATFPVGGVEAVATSVTAGTDIVDTFNQVMTAVELEGLPVTGNYADSTLKGALRGVRDSTGAFLLDTAAATRPGTTGEVYGVPTVFEPFPAAEAVDLISGDWRQLVIGIRQDIRYAMSSDFVIADDTGKVLVTGFQDNQTALKVWARYGAAILNPVSRANPTGANPFAKADAGVALRTSASSSSATGTKATAKKDGA